MIYFFEFIFYIIYIIIKFYSICDNIFLFSYQGSKIDYYLKNNNLNHFKIKNHRDKIKINFNNLFYSNLISINLLLIKTLFSSKFLFSNFIYISLFLKKVEVISKFSFYFIIFKYLYFISFYLFYTILLYNILKRFNNKKNKEYKNLYEGFCVGLDEENKNVIIEKNGLFQNVLITGSIGSGKTSSCINNFLKYLIIKNINGLIIDVKGNYYKIVDLICKKYNLENKLVIITLENNFKYNPLMNCDLNPIEIANNLRKVLDILSKNDKADPYFLDKAEEYIKDFIVLIKVYNNNINFGEIHKLCLDNEYLLNKIKEVKEIVLNKLMDENELFNIKNSIYNLKNEYLKLDDRNINLIKSEITRITSIFVSDSNIYNKFCSVASKINFKEDKIYVLSLDISKNKKLSQIISTYLKLDFQRQILNNNNKEVFFLCDEYQEIANSEDASFLSLSREFKCINIVSMQSYTSLYNKLKDKNSADVIIQNLVNKIWLRNDDINTVEKIIKQIGKEEKEKITFNLTENSKESKYSLVNKKFINNKSSINEGYSFNNSLEYIIDSSYITTKLKTFESICLISNGLNMRLYNKVKMERMEL